MTIDTSKEAVERLLDGVTPGPWGQDGPVSAKIVWAGPDLRVCFLTSDGPASKNARFIAAARELVPALAAERDAQTARADAAEAREQALLSTYDAERKVMVENVALKAEVERLTAALAASRAAPDCHQPDLVTAARVRVKPLVWYDNPPPALDCAWIDDFGLYQITDGAVLFIGNDDTGKQYRTVSDAKAAAQADYEARIISALDLTPAPAVEPVALTAQDAAQVPETDDERFDRADWFWLTMDPDDNGDTPSEAISRAMLGHFCVCEIASSYTGPVRYGFTAPVLDPESDDDEFLHFATRQEAIDAAKERATALRAIGGDE